MPSSNDYLSQRRHSTGSSIYKRSRPVIVPELPESVAWLEHTALEMTATASKSLTHISTEYVLHVHYRPSADPDCKPVSWQVSRSFGEYRTFRKQLLSTLALGHACSAECRWLHSFVKKYFPKTSLLFGSCSTTTMNQRREKLIRFMNVLKSSLLNRGNHGCAILVKSLADEFNTFVKSNDRDNRLAEAEEKEQPDDEEAADRLRRCSTSSSTLSTSSTGDDHDELDNVCDLCHRNMDNHSSDWDSPCNSTNSGSACHTTTLSCGHQFHDSCVLPKLAALSFCCPSCSEPQL